MGDRPQLKTKEIIGDRPRLHLIKRGLSPIFQHKPTTQYHYDAAGRLYQTDQFNGSQTRYRYDKADRLKGLTHTAGNQTLANYQYTLDPNGNRIKAMVEAPQLPEKLINHTLNYSYNAKKNRLNRTSVIIGDRPRLHLIKRGLSPIFYAGGDFGEVATAFGVGAATGALFGATGGAAGSIGIWAGTGAASGAITSGATTVINGGSFSESVTSAAIGGVTGLVAGAVGHRIALGSALSATRRGSGLSASIARGDGFGGLGGAVTGIGASSAVNAVRK